MKTCGTSLLLAWLTLGSHDVVNAQTEFTTFAAAHRYSAVDRLDIETPSVPENISVQPKFRSLLETMLVRSSSFRRQCARIAGERFLLVRLQHVPVRLPGSVRGISHISRHPGGRIVADIVIHPFDNQVEMIAHELEHIIEQLDQIDLREKARRGRSGVHATYGAGVAFETRRALWVGLRVVQEFRQRRGQGSGRS